LAAVATEETAQMTEMTQMPEDCLPILAACDSVVVLMVDGWRHSIGVQAEIQIARDLGTPVVYLSPANIGMPADLAKTDPLCARKAWERGTRCRKQLGNLSLKPCG
jgi:hypothetical protein